MTDAVEAFLSEAIARRTEVDGDCLVWGGGRDIGGYGILRMRVHRVSFVLAHGLIPAGMMVCHSCDHPECINPEHLFLGTAADNNRDRTEKGRTVVPDNRGERHPLARLTAENVALIRRLYAGGGVTQVELAARFGVWQTTISKIVRGDRWAS